MKLEVTTKESVVTTMRNDVDNIIKAVVKDKEPSSCFEIEIIVGILDLIIATFPIALSSKRLETRIAKAIIKVVLATMRSVSGSLEEDCYRLLHVRCGHYAIFYAEELEVEKLPEEIISNTKKEQKVKGASLLSGIMKILKKLIKTKLE
ncbi:hypothetical protein Trydic_g8673 [Trypoxylus dichotomus]